MHWAAETDLIPQESEKQWRKNMKQLKSGNPSWGNFVSSYICIICKPIKIFYNKPEVILKNMELLCISTNIATRKKADPLPPPLPPQTLFYSLNCV